VLPGARREPRAAARCPPPASERDVLARIRGRREAWDRGATGSADRPANADQLVAPGPHCGRDVVPGHRSDWPRWRTLPPLRAEPPPRPEGREGVVRGLSPRGNRRTWTGVRTVKAFVALSSAVLAVILIGVGIAAHVQAPLPGPVLVALPQGTVGGDIGAGQLNVAVPFTFEWTTGATVTLLRIQAIAVPGYRTPELRSVTTDLPKGDPVLDRTLVGSSGSKFSFAPDWRMQNRPGSTEAVAGIRVFYEHEGVVFSFSIVGGAWACWSTASRHCALLHRPSSADPRAHGRQLAVRRGRLPEAGLLLAGHSERAPPPGSLGSKLGVDACSCCAASDDHDSR